MPLVLVGATGVGKSGLAQQLAEATGAEIVGCDSVQIYRGFDIGSAKPGVAARAPGAAPSGRCGPLGRALRTPSGTRPWLRPP